MKKIISFVLAAVLLVSAVPTALATNDYSQGTQVVYEATGNESYTITVPAQLAPGGSGTVALEGTWADNRIITVTADPTVTLTNSIKAEDQKVLNVHFDGISEAGSNTASQTFTQGISVDGITDALFGTWSGKFNYNVVMSNVAGGSGGYDHNAPELHPDDGTTPADGDVYTAGDYEYTYSTSDSGWKVALDATKYKTSYGVILESINGEPVTSMKQTFEGCPNLTTAPEIPASVTKMESTFFECKSLTTAPEIPAGVTNMTNTFVECESLTTAPEIPASVTIMYLTFSGCTGLTTAPEIPDGVTNMYRTFKDCTNLTTAPEIPASVTNMKNTFNGCTSLTGEINIPCSLASYNYIYSDCPATINYYHVDGCDGSCGK